LLRFLARSELSIFLIAVAALAIGTGSVVLLTVSSDLHMIGGFALCVLGCMLIGLFVLGQLARKRNLEPLEQAEKVLEAQRQARLARIIGDATAPGHRTWGAAGYMFDEDTTSLRQEARARRVVKAHKKRAGNASNADDKKA